MMPDVPVGYALTMLGLFVTVLVVAVKTAHTAGRTDQRVTRNEDDIKRHSETQRDLFKKIEEIWRHVRNSK